jgi:hypothetical protein
MAGVPALTPMQAAPPHQLDDNIVVSVRSPEPGQRLEGLLEITGYAGDRRSPNGTGLNERDIQLYLSELSERQLFHYAEGNRDSPEAAQALGPQFRRGGFRAFWETCSFTPGPYKLLVLVSSLVVEGARGLGSVDVDVAPCPPGQILYQDTFAARPGGAWTLRTTEAQRFPGGGLTPTRIFSNIAVGIDARCPEPEPDCRTILFFRRLDGPGTVGTTDGSYQLWVHPQSGRAWLRHCAPGAASNRCGNIIPPVETPAVQPPPQWNRLGVIAQDDWLRIFVNGTLVGEVYDTRRPWGRVSWNLNTMEREREVEAQFRNLVISTPGPPDTLGPVLRGP